jgi:nitrite reductase/ring-hydroxylating ferredoxin subunit
MGRLSFINPWSWYPIAASSDIPRGQILPVTLSGTTLVAWRGQSDKISVWSDRCPHRGMRLCLGGTRDDVLMCPYHGWVFGSDGACTHIPAHPQLTPSRAARARIYPSTESNGYIWACIGEPATPQPAYIMSGGNALTHVRTIHVAADIEIVAAALMARPLTEDTGTSDDWHDDIDWSNTEGLVEARHRNSGSGFSARLEFPGLLSCSVEQEGGAPIRYSALIQPTFADQAAVHLALDGPGPVERQSLLNRNLVQLRRDLQSLSHRTTLDRIAERCADMMPDQARGLTAFAEGES